MSVFEGADLDVVEPELSHEGEGKTFTSTAPTNEPSERPEKIIWFSDDIQGSTPPELNLTMNYIVNLEESGLSSSIRSWKPTQRSKESNYSTVRKMLGLFTMIILEEVSNPQSFIPEPFSSYIFYKSSEAP